jgi:hypothetical protein
MVHNTTEGLAIVASVAKVGKVGIRKRLMMGRVAGVPTIAGALAWRLPILSYCFDNILIYRCRSNISSRLFDNILDIKQYYCHHFR